MWPFDKPKVAAVTKIGHCPRCKRSAPFGKLGIKFQGPSYDYLPRRMAGNYCRFCVPEILHEHLPKITYTEGKENAG